MRTIKALACAAALAAGLATAVAQNVYSLNVVGYYNVTVPQGGIYLMANQLNTTNNQLGNIIPTAQDYTELYFYSNGKYTGYQFVGPGNYGNGWNDPTLVLNPGQAFTVVDPGTPGGQTFTFVGEVEQGNLANTLLTSPDQTANICFRSSIVPQQGTLSGDLGVPAEDYDEAYLWDSTQQKFVGSEDVGPDNFGNGWSPGDPNGPTIGVGQGFAYAKGPGNVSSAWVRNFTVQ